MDELWRVQRTREAVGLAETALPDPDGEDVRGFGTHLTCALPPVGGNNGPASAINNRGRIAGSAQTSVTDSGCPPYQITAAIIWRNGKVQAQVPTVGSDPNGEALGINSQGHATGYSGTCTAAHHAVMWENGTATALPDLGVEGVSGGGISDKGEIVGQVARPDGTTAYGAVWQNKGGTYTITSFNTLRGDYFFFGEGINNHGLAVGSTQLQNGRLVPRVRLAGRRDCRPSHAVSCQFQPLGNHG